jgi:hypothetical protein
VKRRPFNLLAGVSLVLWLAIAALWLRSYWCWDSITWIGDRSTTLWLSYRVYEIESERGGLVLFLEDGKVDAARPSAIRTMSDFYDWNSRGFGFKSMEAKEYPFTMTNARRTFWRSIGLECGSISQTQSSSHDFTVHDQDIAVQARWIVFPHWLVILSFSILPCRWGMDYLRHRRAAHRILKGLCPRCGYDLRATPNCCPECGMVPKTNLISN